MAGRTKRMVARTNATNVQQQRQVRAAQANVKRELAKRRKEGKTK